MKPFPVMVTVIPPAVGPESGPTLLIASDELELPPPFPFDFLSRDVIEHAGITTIESKGHRDFSWLGPKNLH